MIWNGTDPLQPDHEVAYRGWPTVKVSLYRRSLWIRWLKPPIFTICDHEVINHTFGGHVFYRLWSPHSFDLIPLQQEQPK